MRASLIIMARVPQLGAVKKRLAREIGAVAAVRLYRKMLQICLALSCDHLWRTYIALTPDHIAYPLIVPRVAQGHGNLGQRMERLARHTLRYGQGAVIFIGSDAPLIRPHHIRQALRGLQHHDVVFGPSCDGGYWLVGLRNPALMMFRNVRWSTPHALADTKENVGAKKILFLETLRDIDEKEDLLALANHL